MKGIRGVVTYKCNIMCSCCTYRCGPHRKGIMDVKDFERYIKDYYDEGYSDYIIIEGGEPLLQSGIIFKYLKSIRNINSRKYIVTNGYWGNLEAYIYILEDIKNMGLSGIILEYDYFHSIFIDFKTIKNAIEKSLQWNLEVWVKAFFSNSGINCEEDEITFDYIKEIKKNYGEIKFIFQSPDKKKMPYRRAIGVEEKTLMYRCIDS